MTDETELAPCPFCGGNAAIIQAKEAGNNAYCVVCKKCDACSQVIFAEKTDVKSPLQRLWNNRTRPTPAPDSELGDEILHTTAMDLIDKYLAKGSHQRDVLTRYIRQQALLTPSYAQALGDAVALREKVKSSGGSHEDVIEQLGCWLFDEIRALPKNSEPVEHIGGAAMSGFEVPDQSDALGNSETHTQYSMNWDTREPVMRGHNYFKTMDEALEAVSVAGRKLVSLERVVTTTTDITTAARQALSTISKEPIDGE